MKSWIERPQELANLFNPSFCAIVITSALIGYKSIESNGIPLPLAYMVLPIVLHKPTRDVLPKSKKKSPELWFEENSTTYLGFHDRVISMKPYTQESLLFGFINQFITLNSTGELVSPLNPNKVDSFLRKMEGDARECILSSRNLGKWFGYIGSAEKIMYLWGIRP